jgi:hypothetical protein
VIIADFDRARRLGLEFEPPAPDAALDSLRPEQALYMLVMRTDLTLNETATLAQRLDGFDPRNAEGVALCGALADAFDAESDERAVVLHMSRGVDA